MDLDFTDCARLLLTPMAVPTKQSTPPTVPTPQPSTSRATANPRSSFRKIETGRLVEEAAVEVELEEDAAAAGSDKPGAEPPESTTTVRKRKVPVDHENPDPSIFPKQMIIESSSADPDFVPSVFPDENNRSESQDTHPDSVPSVSTFPTNKHCQQKTDEEHDKPKKKTSPQPNAAGSSSSTASSGTTTDASPKQKKKQSKRKGKMELGTYKRRKVLDTRDPESESSNAMFSVGRNIQIEWRNLLDLTIQHKQLQTMYTELRAVVDSLSAQNDRLKEDLQRVLPRFTYASIKGDGKQLLLLTGLPPLVFEWLLSQISNVIQTVLPELTPGDHLLMLLMKLKLGVGDADLAYRFRTFEGSVLRVCQTWLPALAHVLKPLIAWPSAQIVSKTVPDVFKGQFKRCRCIVDCLEFVAVRTGKNDVKHERTVKYLVSLTPAGAVSFLSRGQSGNTYERTLIMESGFLHLLDAQDDLLADRPVPIRDEVASLGATLHTPDSNSERQNYKSDSEKQSNLVWTRVKKIMGWWRGFSMLQKVIPEPYADLLDEVLIVCAALTNVNMCVAPGGFIQL